MDELIIWNGVKILFTTGADKHECQAWTLWDEADVVISIVGKTARVLKQTDPDPFLCDVCSRPLSEHGPTLEHPAGATLKLSACGAYAEFQSKHEGCRLPAGHAGDHAGDDLDLIDKK